MCAMMMMMASGGGAHTSFMNQFGIIRDYIARVVLSL
jgi:hypothetical protein